jgi:hypothetical protein
MAHHLLPANQLTYPTTGFPCSLSEPPREGPETYGSLCTCQVGGLTTLQPAVPLVARPSSLTAAVVLLFLQFLHCLLTPRCTSLSDKWDFGTGRQEVVAAEHMCCYVMEQQLSLLEVVAVLIMEIRRRLTVAAMGLRRRRPAMQPHRETLAAATAMLVLV